MTITRGTVPAERPDIWKGLAAPLPSGAISWRQDGKATARDGKFFARFVAYVEAGTVRERLDSVCPGEWDLTLEMLPPTPYTADEDVTASFKARLQVLGVIREDVGTGRDYKSASTDAFKRAAVRFGIGGELYSFEQNWVQVDGDGKFAKAVEDPQKAYERRTSGAEKGRDGAVNATAQPTPGTGEPTPASQAASLSEVACPKCGGRMYNNTLTKRNPKSPDYVCQAKSRSCDGVIWPEKKDSKRPVVTEKGIEADPDSYPDALRETEDAELPF